MRSTGLGKHQTWGLIVSERGEKGEKKGGKGGKEGGKGREKEVFFVEFLLIFLHYLQLKHTKI